MPYAALSRRQFAGFRTGQFFAQSRTSQNPVLARFIEAWAFDDDVQPLFPVPSCVLFADSGAAGELPPNVRRASGQLPRRDATPDEAERCLNWRDAPWPEMGDDGAAVSPYQRKFRQGATLVPRFLCFVEPAAAGPLGGAAQAPLVVSRRSRLEKAPWKDLDSLTGNLERQFLRPVYLGESVAPFRLLEPPLGVIPYDTNLDGLLDATSAGLAGYAHLADWMSKAEQLWNEHRRSDRLSFGARTDYHRGLRSQFPVPPLRVLYSASGTLMAAAVLTDPEPVIEHKLYWAAVRSLSEARYLIAVLNSEAARRRVATLQSRGQWGARDFDKVMWTLPIKEFDSDDPLHTALATAGHRAETVAAQVPLKEGVYFVTARRQIRRALAEDGVASEIDELVTELIGPGRES